MPAGSDLPTPHQQRQWEIVLDRAFIEHLRYWTETNPRTAGGILQLVEVVMREPFTGLGKPEPLKHLGPNLWSRRITDEHRLVYRVDHDRITFLQGRFHYGR